MTRIGPILLALVLAGCASRPGGTLADSMAATAIPSIESEAPTPSATVGATPSATPTGVNESAFTRVTCDLSPGFPVELLEGSGECGGRR